ncbi:MAG: hypothetical protein D6698_12045 [Gammaproteobacteria bacterium]|nr:MAG: hypothetical protein D6698_12045 [Gammaproteobacteria bacterium]
MAYTPSIVPLEYDPAFLYEELDRIARSINELKGDMITLYPRAVPPTRPQEGMVVNADGTNWNPGGGAGLYQYLSGSWVKL